MIFLNEKVTALAFGAICFFVSAISGIYQGTLIRVVITRGLIFSIIALGIGYIFGIVIKQLFLETILKETEKEEERIREVNAQKAKEEEERLTGRDMLGEAQPPYEP